MAKETLGIPSEMGDNLNKKKIKIKTKNGWQEGWQVLFYDSEQDRYFINPANPVDIEKHSQQWIKRKDFEVIS